MTIGLPIEIKVREYLSKIFLGIKLVEKLNQDVLIGEKNKVSITRDLLKTLEENKLHYKLN